MKSFALSLFYVYKVKKKFTSQKSAYLWFYGMLEKVILWLEKCQSKTKIVEI